jgi:hypothetical protein
VRNRIARVGSRTNPWRYFAVLVNGRNFHLLWEGRGPRPHVRRCGFHTTAHVRARSEKEAEMRAVAVLRRDKKLRLSLRNPRSDPPTLFVERIEELSSFKGRLFPRTGFAFYGERGPRAAKGRRHR